MSSLPVETDRAISPGSDRIAAEILDRVRELGAGFRERALRTERQARVPEESIRELDEAGVFKMAMPVEYGGYALTPGQICPVFSEIASACGSTGWVAWLTTTGVHPATVFPHQFQAELFGPGWDGPLQSGAISKFAPGVGRRVPGGLMIKGRWAWASGCHHTRFHILSVMVDGGESKESFTCQVPHEQISILDDWTVMGMQGSGSNTIAIDEEIFVPGHRILPTGALFAGLRPAPQPAGLLFKAAFAQVGPVTIASLGIGLARAAIAALRAKADGRAITFTPHRDQLQATVTHLQLAEMWAKLNACEAVNARSIARIEAKAEAGVPMTALEAAEVRAGTAYICVLAKEIADMALRASGASSIHQANPLQRIMRDATTLSIHAQTNVETAYEDLGRIMAGLPGFSEPPRKVAA